MSETYGGPDVPSEVYYSVMKADRSVDRDGVLHPYFTAYAYLMLFVWPLGVPCLYAIMVFRSRKALQELRRIELEGEVW